MDIDYALVTPNVIAGDNLYMRSGTYTADYTVGWHGGSNGLPIALQSYNNENAIIDGSAYINHDYITLKGLRIKNSGFTDRTLDTNGGELPPGINEAIHIQGNNVIIQDCILENCAEGIYSPNTIDNLVVDGCIIFYNGWQDADLSYHGHGVYSKRSVTYKNCIIFRNSALGIQIYGTGNRDDVTLQDNISFCAGDMFASVPECNILHSTGANMVWRRNYTYHRSGHVKANDYGYGGAFSGAVMVDNYLPDGYSNSGGGTFAEQSGNVTAPEVTNRVKLISIRGRAHVAVYNWQHLDSVVVDVSSVFSNGTNVMAINVQDYFVDRQSLTVSGGNITINMQAGNRTIATPQGIATPTTTFPEFGCFVVVAA